MKSGRNDLCPCGSGKKYKRCCLAKPARAGHVPDLGALYDQAVSTHSLGPLDQAAGLCRRILEIDPAHTGALHMLAIIAGQTGKPDTALELLRKVVSLDPQNVTYHSNFGAALQKLGYREQAEAEYRAALSLAPDDTNTLSNFGGLLHDLGRFDEALPLLEKAVTLEPDFAMAQSNLALVLLALERPQDALEHLKKATDLDPKSLEFVVRCVRKLSESERWRESEPYLKRWIELDPANAEAFQRLGYCYSLRDLRGEAAECYAKAFRLKPVSTVANNLGVCFDTEGYQADAIIFLRKAVDLDPNFVEAWVNLGKVLKDVGQPETGARCYDRALALQPRHVGALWGRSLCLLALGKLADGWADYEFGWDAGARKPVRPFSQPRWEGQDPAGKTILVWMEQGLGDHILFASMLPDLIGSAAHCIIEAEYRLTALFQRSFPGAETVTASQPPNPRTQEPDIDFQVPIASLARWLRPTIESFPKRLGYLVPHPVRAEHWKERIRALGEGLKVGICWRSMLNKGPRSIYYSELNQWGPILTIPGVHFINLLYDECRKELREAEQMFGTRIHTWSDTDLRMDLETVVALISNLDLVISSGSTPAAMAGAVGVPTWSIARAARSDWVRLGTDYYPWQPSVRCFYAEANEPWEPVLENIGSELSRFAAPGRPPDRRSDQAQPCTQAFERVGPGAGDPTPLLVGVASDNDISAPKPS